jgi:hypothetical protein
MDKGIRTRIRDDIDSKNLNKVTKNFDPDVIGQVGSHVRNTIFQAVWNQVLDQSLRQFFQDVKLR